jgi:hypothetical protein
VGFGGFPAASPPPLFLPANLLRLRCRRALLAQALGSSSPHPLSRVIPVQPLGPFPAASSLRVPSAHAWIDATGGLVDPLPARPRGADELLLKVLLRSSPAILASTPLLLLRDSEIHSFYAFSPSCHHRRHHPTSRATGHPVIPSANASVHERPRLRFLPSLAPPPRSGLQSATIVTPFQGSRRRVK